MLILAVIVLLIVVFNPPNIWWIMQIGATVVICAMLPVGIGSIWSKRMTKAGAFWGMLVGFTVSFVMKLITTSQGITVPIYFDVYLVGTASNVIAMLIANRLTKPTPEEIAAREALFVVPEGEDDPVEVEKTRRALKSTIWIGIGIFVFSMVTWVIPYYMG